MREDVNEQEKSVSAVVVTFAVLSKASLLADAYRFAEVEVKGESNRPVVPLCCSVHLYVKKKKKT